MGSSSQSVDDEINAWLKKNHERFEVVMRTMCMTTTIVGEVIHKTTLWYRPVYPPYYGAEKPQQKVNALS